MDSLGLRKREAFAMFAESTNDCGSETTEEVSGLAGI